MVWETITEEIPDLKKKMQIIFNAICEEERDE